MYDWLYNKNIKFSLDKKITFLNKHNFVFLNQTH